MKALVLATVLAAATPALASDILVEPPREAFGLGLVLNYEGGVVQQMQREQDILEACGPDWPFGCITWLGEDTCQIRIWIGLPFELREQAFRNLIARCAGWAP